MSRIGLVLLTAGLLFPSASHLTQSSPPDLTYRISQAPPELRQAIQRGELVIISLQDAMLAELSRDMDQGGVALAVRTCHVDTTSVAYRIAKQEGIQVGRTSDRLRVPTNVPKPWAAPIVAQYAGRRAADVEGFAVDLGDRVGVLRPMVERPLCQACHGDRDALDPRVRHELDDRYPRDRALFFRPGEVRGWFWAEVPKQRKS